MTITSKIKNFKPMVLKLFTLFKRFKSRNYDLGCLDEMNWGIDVIYAPRIVRIRSFGKENKDRTIMIVGFPKGWTPTAGFFALLNRSLCGIYFADRMGFTPVMENWDHCPYEEDHPINETDNVFEYYFKPLSDINMQSALNSYRVTYSTNPNMDLILHETKSEWFHLSDDYIEEMGRVYSKYIHLNDYTQQKIDKDIGTILIPGKSTLAVHYRGSDYKLNMNGHPKALEPEDYYPVIDKAINDYHFDNIFLATDDENALNEFLERYDNITYYKDVNRTTGETSLAYIESERKDHKYLSGYEVIRDSYTLASCDGLIAGYSQVSVGARINKASQKKEYKFCKIIDKGVNNNNRDWITYYNKKVKKKNEA